VIRTLAVSNYRSLKDFKLDPAPLTIVSGANGSGKSNLYRALRILQSAADGTLAATLAAEGGIPSIQWAGPADVRAQAKRGVAFQGTARTSPLRVSFGFATEDVAYEIALGLPAPSSSLFALDPEVKSEHVWHSPPRRKANTYLERSGPAVHARSAGGDWELVDFRPPPHRSVLAELSEPGRFPEVFALRERVRKWRFYDGFRTDAESPIRLSRVGVRTEMLAHDGRDLAAALQTILEVGNDEALHTAIDDAFPGARLVVSGDEGARLRIALQFEGLLRPMDAAELSDGTLRYLCLVAALHGPRPPELVVLNEPEGSLHPDLLRPLARQIAHASERTQLWVITHSQPLVEAIERLARVDAVELGRVAGETRIRGQDTLDEPAWP